MKILVVGNERVVDHKQTKKKIERNEKEKRKDA